MWHARFGAASFASLRFDFQPVRSCRAGIAIAAGLPFGFLAKVQANVALAALAGLHETLDFVITLPGAGFLRGVFDFADKKGVQAGVCFLPERTAIGGEGGAAGAARFLGITVAPFRERESDHRPPGRLCND